MPRDHKKTADVFFKAAVFGMATWVLFNAIFFLGTHPAKWIATVFDRMVRLTLVYAPDSVFRDFLVHGLITGIAGFCVYVPNIAALFFVSHLLYETGVSTNAARFVNPLFRHFGLNGYSFQPLLFGFGCSVNAIISARSIVNPKHRLLTMLITPFASCGSKFGVYVMLISMVFEPHWAGTVLFGMYALGIVAAIASSLLFRKIFSIKKEALAGEIHAVLIKAPCMRTVLLQTLRDGLSFFLKAGSVIVVAACCIWTLSYWPGISQERYAELAAYAGKTHRQLPPRQTIAYHNSYAARLGQYAEPVFKPLGQNWKTSIALITSIAGRSTIISTLVTLYGIEQGPDSHRVLTHALTADTGFSKRSGLAMMVFVLLCGSCLASITMFFNETRSLLQTALFVAYPIVLAWAASSLFFTLGTIWVRTMG
ncbi:MAG: ferrous iron transporter B [Chitinispirillaceae bacterium]|nr:ferrous iron transporter B [Chitinispirillaceae bacterium]